MRRTLALAILTVVLVTISAPLIEAATDHCGKVRTCCSPIQDDCGMTMCASTPEPATAAASVTITINLKSIPVTEAATVDAPRRSATFAHSSAAPPPTRVRLARLETLLI